MRIILLLPLLFCLVYINPVLAQKTISQKKVKSEIANLYTTKVYKGPKGDLVYETIDSLPAGHIFAGLTNQNRLYLDYITQHYANPDRKKLEALNSDPQKRHLAHARQLQADPLFTKYFMELAYYYLQASGTTIKGYQASPKMTVTEDKLTGKAAKFFYAQSLKKDGNIGWKICVGFNELGADKKTDLEPLVEAFCFQTVMNNIQHPDSGYYADFIRSAKTISASLKEESDKEQKLTQARQQMYLAMQQSDALKQVLRMEYERKKNMLAFELVK